MKFIGNDDFFNIVKSLEKVGVTEVTFPIFGDFYFTLDDYTQSFFDVRLQDREEKKIKLCGITFIFN